MSVALLDDKLSPFYLITANDGIADQGLMASWVMKASLRNDEIRFTMTLSKFNDTTQSVLKSKRFIIHLITTNDIDLAYTFSTAHSSATGKFKKTAFVRHNCGILYWGQCVEYALANTESYLETPDRYIFYCRTIEQQRLSNNENILTVKSFFENLSSERSKFISEKFKNDSSRDQSCFKAGEL
jgi:flavin reductase (DIM6/NTAB) family NADH-FMN oxidoreductase RutF